MAYREKEVGIVILTYNMPRLLDTQIQLVQRFCKDQYYEIIIADNSSNKEAARAIEYWASYFKLSYFKMSAASKYSSVSATFGLNTSYTKLKGMFDYFLYLDHDCFPLRDFSVVEELGDKIMAGIGQQKSKMYYHTGYLMWNNREIDREMIDFSCNDQYKLDTGGNLYKIVDHYGDRCKFLNEQYYENPYFKKGFYNFYSTFNDDGWMHFINGAGWNREEVATQDERINSLLNVLMERVGTPNV